MNTTPCGVLYQALSECAGLKSYDEIDARIISRTHLDKKGRSPYERILRAGSYRTREIIQKEPSLLDPRIFRESHKACHSIVSFLKSRGCTNEQITNYFSGDAADAMTASLRIWGFDQHVFRNCMNDITRNNDPDQLNTAVAVMMLFMITAFHADPRESLPEFFRTMQTQAISVAFDTGVLADDFAQTAAETYPLLGLVRRFPDGKMGTRVYKLNPNPNGTIIGRRDIGESSITEVGATVSRRHLVIFRHDATWYAQGLESTNGSSILHPNGILDVIEPPASVRTDAHESLHTPIHPDDVLKLGLDTEFLVLLIGHGI